MKLSVILATVMLVGCTTAVPITNTFPTPPDLLMESCGPLNTINKEKVLLDEFLKTVISNYEKYHICADLVKSWQEWYTQQQTIQQSINKP